MKLFKQVTQQMHAKTFNHPEARQLGSAMRWQSCVAFVACDRLAAAFAWDDLVYTQIFAMMPAAKEYLMTRCSAGLENDRRAALPTNRGLS